MKLHVFISIIFIFLLAYTSQIYSGFNQEWERRLPFSSNSSNYPSIALDKNDNIYILSTFDADTTSGYRNVIKLTKYLPDGIQSWSVNYNNPSNSAMNPLKMIITGNSDIFILGSANIADNYDYLVLKYNSLGVFQWAYQYDSPGNDNPTDFTIDISGNIYVTGTAHFNGTNQPVPNTIKISPLGSLIWHKSIQATYSAYNTGGIVTDLSGNIYTQYKCTCFETGSVRFLKYNPNGDTLWDHEITYYGFSGSSTFAGLQRDSSNNIYYAFSETGMISAYLFVEKFDVSGTLLTNNNYSIYPASGPSLSIGGFKIMNDNSVVLTGGEQSQSGMPYKILMCMFNPSGVLIKTVRLALNNGYSCYGKGICLDKLSNIYICGTAYTGSSTIEYLTVKYNSNGDSLYSAVYNGPFSYSESSGIVVDTLNNVYVTGRTKETSNSYSAATIKYSQAVGITKISSNVPDKFSLSQNYPNPFNPTTVINYKLPITDYVRLAIYDILGSEVTILVNATQQAGEYQVTWDSSNFASGIYFYKLVSENFIETKRMVLVK